MKYWGYSATIDCGGCPVELIDDPKVIEGFVKDLVESIEMKAYGEPLIVSFANHDPEKGGYSLVQLIETSNITGHFVPALNECYIDVFSCMPFSVEVVAEVVKRWFKPNTTLTNMNYRKALTI